MKFQDDISMPCTRTQTHTDKPKPICPPLFQSWGHKKMGNGRVGGGGRGQVGEGQVGCELFQSWGHKKWGIVGSGGGGGVGLVKVRLDVNEELRFM